MITRRNLLQNVLSLPLINLFKKPTGIASRKIWRSTGDYTVRDNHDGKAKYFYRVTYISLYDK